jgi:HAD superfamily hydrolase (TIGR01549 family)
VRALIVSGGGFQGLSLIQLLRADPGSVVAVADVYPRNVTTFLADHYEVVPPLREEQAFRAALLDLCRRLRIQVIFPATELELAALALLAPALEELGAVAAVSPAALITRLGSKRGLAAFCSAHGIPTPTHFEPSQAAGRYPLLLKPERGWGGREQRVIGSAAELPADMTGQLLQELLVDFDEFSVDFALTDGGGRSPLGVRKRIRVSGGFAVVAETRHDPDVLALSDRMINALAAERARGLFNLQLLRDGRGLWASDLNLRAGTSTAHWADEPDNPALWFARQALGQPGAGAADVLGVPGTEVFRVLRELRFTGVPDPTVGAVVFDLDDTLICQRTWAAERLAGAAARLMQGEEARAAWLARALRIAEESGLAHIFDHMAVELAWSESEKLAVIEAFRASWPDAIEPLPGVMPVLETLRARGYRLVLLTDNPPATQRRKLRLSRLDSALDSIVFSQEYGAEKPDPACFRAAAGAAGCEPARAVMVGDNPYRDAAGAIDAGFRRAYLLQREGHQRFLPRLWRAALGESRVERVVSIESPLELLRYLPGSDSVRA